MTMRTMKTMMMMMTMMKEEEEEEMEKISHLCTKRIKVEVKVEKKEWIKKKNTEFNGIYKENQQLI